MVTRPVSERGGALAGSRVLVTRPREEAGALCAAIEAEGGRTVRWPALEVGVLADLGAARAALAPLQPGDAVVFVSRNAVRHGWALLPEAARAGELALLAVGPGTAQALRELGAREVLCPDSRYDSEGLLALQALEPARVRGRRVVIVRGVGGRESLAEGLRARGAQVRYAEVYARRPSSRPLAEALGGLLPQATVLTSGEALEHWVGRARAEGLERLLDTPLVLVSERLAVRARELGVRGPLRVAGGAGEAAVVEALAGLVAEPAERG